MNSPNVQLFISALVCACVCVNVCICTCVYMYISLFVCACMDVSVNMHYTCIVKHSLNDIVIMPFDVVSVGVYVCI